ncbi:MAG: hypothetical protein M1820_001262 [Bogoriella megaspora]|nr:MAG: hypothetical protein M1820_001262 [Bogoriella megaspora]
MREGYVADDKWIMVEDEFLETARQYTQHLHHAEYVRLKHSIKAEKASEIKSIVRPTVNEEQLSSERKKALDAKAVSRKQQDALQDIRGTSSMDASDDEEPFIGNSYLSGLMQSPPRTSRKLSGLSKAGSNTRAAAGFSKPAQSFSSSQQPSEQSSSIDSHLPTKTKPPYQKSAEADVSDNLDAQPQLGHLNWRPGGSNPSKADRRRERKVKFSSNDPDLTAKSPARHKEQQYREFSGAIMDDSLANPSRNSSNVLNDLKTTFPACRLDTENMPQDQDSAAAMARVKERREARKRAREGQKRAKPLQLDEVPTFLV